MPRHSSAKRIEGKVALITGAGSGIGKAAAIRFAEEGANLVLLDRDRQTLAAVCREAEAIGAKSIAVEADISDEHSLEEAYGKAISAFGQLDIVFANAGINGTISPIEHMSKEEWEKTIAVNLTGTFLTVKHAIPLMKKRGGSIIVTSSINGNRVFSNFGFSAYSSSKAGETAFTRMAALELAEYGIRVNAICPGAISTNIDQSTKPKPEVEEIRIPVEFPEGGHPLENGPGKPEQVANLVLFLASDESSHITGTPVYIDGAESLLRG
ncbi:SDR family oxidoreductase [Paenibacillus glycanilyticus]|uniref:SDR family oxidoreductase n=1 Tax=Paenibacillus glycanilyticus TaxID=126569 RepID=UPI0020412171|nr:SDR family NAD(P)-dependent oxidoreductase [Paenibacillus glycanilyticus]MCM3630974.1 SDR family oxidoreductase [Paenibacillus glycanilyticus]